ncbi:MAG: phosphoribosylaminoimidazolesuccinocarboxamide synthase [Planctomycetota bacterium]|jgi:phosphoribosylaminoimidazole-succinocarboxamide synthase|nr:phosphoribosylaminoimidazolesuccinocarboxamide synthase [Planctomycetota bacterium]
MNGGEAMFESSLPGLPVPRRGKVRDVYDLGERLLLVATDRISAFDVVFPTPIPGKGKVLTGLSLFWLDRLRNSIPNHLLSDSIESLDLPSNLARELAGRSLLVRKAGVIPFECIVRGYVIGTGWKDYLASGGICGIKLPVGLRLADRLPEAIFTPSTKAEAGHDENVPFQRLRESVGPTVADRMRGAALDLYNRAAEYARGKGIIIADTKFEFGLANGEVILVDEILTPDSSRFWLLDAWRPGENPPSFDKQYLRDWLERESGWNKEPPAPVLPEKVVEATRSRYLEAYHRLSGKQLSE